MSAFIVSKDHIDYLVHAAQLAPRRSCSNCTIKLADYGAHTEPDQVGRTLWTFNVRAVEFRYAHHGTLDDDHMPGPGGLTWADVQAYRCPTFPTKRFDPVAALKALDCYEYQTCEHWNWNEEAGKPIRAFCDHLRSSLTSALPGYEDAPWEIDADTVIPAEVS